MPGLEGTTLANRYQDLELLGEGAMAHVYRAYDRQRKCAVALKLLRADYAEDYEFEQRFRMEAQTLEKLAHPNVVRYYGLERDGRSLFMVMEYVAGETLRAEMFSQKGVLSGKRILEILYPLAVALDFAHARGVLHRDIKPANVLLAADGRVLLSDFGVARLMDASTVTTFVVGTPAYMSPEQCASKELTAKSDIYSFAVMAFEMLCGRRPFVGETAGLPRLSLPELVRMEHLSAQPPIVLSLRPTLPAGLDAVFARSLAKQPARRPATVAEMVEGLEPLIKDVPGPAVAVKKKTPRPSTAAGGPVAGGGGVKAPVVEPRAPYFWWAVAGAMLFAIFVGGLVGTQVRGRATVAAQVGVPATVVPAPTSLPKPTRMPATALPPTAVPTAVPTDVFVPTLPPPTATRVAVAIAVAAAPVEAVAQFPTAVPTGVQPAAAGPAVIKCKNAGEWTGCGGKSELGLCAANQVGHCTDQLVYVCEMVMTCPGGAAAQPGAAAASVAVPPQNSGAAARTCSNKGEWTACGGKAELGICAPKEVGHCTDQNVYECVVDAKCSAPSNASGASAGSFPPPTIISCKPNGGLINISGVRAWWVEHRYSFGVYKYPGNGNTGTYMTRYERAIYTALDGSEGNEWCRGDLWK